MLWDCKVKSFEGLDRLYRGMSRFPYAREDKARLELREH